VHRKYFRPPRHLVKEWPEVFEDLYIDTMPVAYLDSMIVEFSDGRIWEIDVNEHLKSSDSDSVSKKLLSILSEYKETIKKLDFKINIERLKNDIKNRTDQIF
jgi:hypothetical protein